MPHAQGSTTNPSSNHISNSIAHIGHSPIENSGSSQIPILLCSMHITSPFWIIDSGANDHVCSSLHWFSSYHQIQHVSVFLPNGSIVEANHAGTNNF